jgi:hypothetical protein
MRRGRGKDQKKSQFQNKEQGSGKMAKAGAENYTKPALREKIKKQILAGDKGGRPGQWSARKAQLLIHEYEAHRVGFRRPRNAAQKSLKHPNWT